MSTSTPDVKSRLNISIKANVKVFESIIYCKQSHSFSVCMYKSRGSVTTERLRVSCKLKSSYHLIAPFFHPLAQVIQLLFILDCAEWSVPRKTVQHDLIMIPPSWSNCSLVFDFHALFHVDGFNFAAFS